MYIEFKSAGSNPQFLIGHIFKMLEEEIKHWSQVNNIKYTSKYYKRTFRIAFDDDKHYTAFRLTWVDLAYTEYKIIDNKW